MQEESSTTDASTQAGRAPAGNPSRTVLIKYGGNAMVDPGLVDEVLGAVAELHREGSRVLLVHGGGPFIGELLEQAGIPIEFVDGQRRTNLETMKYVGMALSGQVNGAIVRKLGTLGVKAVGVSGRDAGMVLVNRRRHITNNGDGMQEIDIGYVGDVRSIDTSLLVTLLDAGYLPVVSPVSVDENGDEFNVNADMFAGHLAGALKVDDYIVLTDVDGICRDKDDPATLIEDIDANEVRGLIGNVVAGGMIPKVEACLAAIEGGVSAARIVNGTDKDKFRSALFEGNGGTLLRGA